MTPIHLPKISAGNWALYFKMNKIGAEINTVNHVFLKKEYSIFVGRISVLRVVGNHLFNFFVPFREP